MWRPWNSLSTRSRFQPLLLLTVMQPSPVLPYAWLANSVGCRSMMWHPQHLMSQQLCDVYKDVPLPENPSDLRTSNNFSETEQDKFPIFTTKVNHNEVSFTQPHHLPSHGSYRCNSPERSIRLTSPTQSTRTTRQTRGKRESEHHTIGRGPRGTRHGSCRAGTGG
jgi:hypothetical protein